ncbi:3-oxoacyl-ACP reductase FabG [Periweissella fabaria]|uniref:3-oxoacyl-[acyl-carrier-protein] reductase FabG n=1 Tax=Periweissella fabaria TaxID=546157 RepID=A0ABM8Z721_9LACO|nr:3-oxoacyl-ACP reductase FabG [Periweissella fabaria]MCM0597151.1 3-oxoacyl-ACP reductase FabG [Periweissella fabaria]CAH0417064.1 3-oxoacyl-[acyl-carrier-protein] reductase FabG [Periweissella fabaria]
MQLTDKIVLVTGSTRGIGLATAHAFAAAGAQVILHGRKQPSDEILAQFTDYQHQPAVCLGDLADENAVAELLAAVKEIGFVDILVNNAGITDDSLAMGMKPAQFMHVIQTNLIGTFNLTQPIFKQMLKKRTGTIINMSSVVGIGGNVGQANYAASKAGIIGLTKTLAKEGAMRGIRVNAIAPGMIATDMTAVLSEKVQTEILEQIPLKRFGEAQEIAQTALFLAQNDYITGQTIVVDGGMIG